MKAGKCSAPRVLHHVLSNFWNKFLLILHRQNQKSVQLIQAGLYNSQSCEDQITQIVQAIKDGFQQHPMQRSVLALLDFSEVYDMVLRKK